MIDYDVETIEGKRVSRDMFERELKGIFSELEAQLVPNIHSDYARNYFPRGDDEGLGELYAIYDSKETIVTFDGDRPDNLAKRVIENTKLKFVWILRSE